MKYRVNIFDGNMKDRKKQFIKYIIIAVVVSAENVLFLNNAVIGMLFIVIEVLYLMYLLFYRKIVDYIIYYVIFVSSCMEFSYFTGNEMAMYNLKNINVGPINLAALLLLPIFVKIIINPVRIGSVRTHHKNFYTLGKFMLIMNIIAMAVGFITIAANDNGIQGLEGLWSKYIGMIYTMAFVPTCMYFAFLYILGYEEECIYKIPIGLQAAIIGPVVQVVVSLASGTMGYYGGVETAVVSTLGLYVPVILLAFLDKSIVFPLFMLITGIVGTILMLLYNSGGKFIIIVVIILVVLVWNILKNKNKYIKLFLIMLMVIMFAIFPSIIGWLAEHSIIFSSKFGQVKGLLVFWGNDWLSNMPESPRYRIEELIDIFIEFINKPWFILTGKGYLGSIKDYTGFFGAISIAERSGGFSVAEWNNGTFYALHEFCSNLIVFGGIGIVFFIKLIKCTKKNIQQNMWLIAGILWFVTSYSYSFTVASFGVVALFYGLSNNEKRMVL